LKEIYDKVLNSLESSPKEEDPQQIPTNDNDDKKYTQYIGI